MTLKERIQKIVCAIFDHSHIHRFFLGYHYCGRCGATLGDSWAGVYYNPRAVYIEHDCDRCLENYEKLSWKDKFLIESPLTKKQKKKDFILVEKNNPSGNHLMNF